MLSEIKIILFFTFICFTSTLLYSQNIARSIKGTVFDDNNEPVPFVNIWIKNDKINIGTSSDMQGKFTLSLNGANISDTITFSCIGYNSFYLPVSKLENSNNLKIILTQKVDILDEIVISAKKTGIKEIIKKYNSNRGKYMSKSNVEYEVFARQFVKICDDNTNKYVTLIESVLKMVSSNEEKEITNSEFLYGNKITSPDIKKDCYDTWYSPDLDFGLYWKYHKIEQSRNFRVDTILPLDNGFVYVITNAKKTLNILDSHHEIVCDEDTVIYEYAYRTFYITNEYKLIKRVSKSYFDTSDSYKWKYNNDNVSRRNISCFVEIDYEDFDNIIYPVRMKCTRNEKVYNKKDEFCSIQKHITEYYMKKIKESDIPNISYKNHMFLDFHYIPITKENTDYEDYMIYDNLRKRVIEDINKK